jgi:outer membrane protein TolC
VLASIALAVNLPIYDGGARAADVTAAEERVIQASLAYRDTVLNAVAEVEAALLGYVGARDRRDALRVAVERNRRAFEQSQQLYREGFANFIDVLDSRRELTTTLQDLARADRDLSVEVVNLYTALGGTPDAERPSA